MSPRSDSKGSPHRRRWPWILLAAFILVLAASAGGLWAVYLYFSYDLPKLDTLSDYQPKTISRIYAGDGVLIAEFFKERRDVVPLKRMPQMLIDAFVAAEDANFFSHPGLDIWAIFRAAVRNLEAGRIVQGGSTITQQVCKSFLLTPEKSYRRKIREALLAYRIDKKFTKSEVLYLYLNQIYLGEGAYGVEAASQVYFGKSVEELTLAECALLAGLPQAPSRYSPRTNPSGARERQVYALNRMAEEGYINRAQAREAAAERIMVLASRLPQLREAPYFVEHIRGLIEAKYGPKALLEDGLKVYTTLNISLQSAAESAVVKGLTELDKREGFRGPVERLDPSEAEVFLQRLADQASEADLIQGRILPGLVLQVAPSRALVHLGPAQGTLNLEEMKWARRPNPEKAYYQAALSDVGQALAPGDVVLVRLKEKNEEGRWQLLLEQEPLAQGALVCMEAATGHVLALVGGRDYNQSQFNRATQALRQPGSAFKPLIYAAALDKGFTPASVIIDAPVVFKMDHTGRLWKPRNYSEKFYGPTTFRTALEKSRNVVTVKILDQIGIDYALGYAQRMGINSTLTPNLSLALGTCEVRVVDMVRAYSSLCNQGLRTEPIFITRIEDRNGRIMEEGRLQQERVIEPVTAYIITRLMEGVVQNGTGWRVKALKRPVAGKTGTTNELKDAWFVGYTPDLITAVWAGHDDHTSMGRGETGSRTASPIWIDFMQAACQNRPVRAFPVPKGVAFASIDRETGLLAGPGTEKIIVESFKPGTQPTQSAAAAARTYGRSDFLKDDFGDY
ncbi:MAG: penicillin-binding protein 1A [Deltaproteobacteria bacterium]|nr:penicillin-binding protein 1A [Deltaproteobacteria bacterium]